MISFKPWRWAPVQYAAIASARQCSCHRPQPHGHMVTERLINKRQETFKSGDTLRTSWKWFSIVSQTNSDLFYGKCNRGIEKGSTESVKLNGFFKLSFTPALHKWKLIHNVSSGECDSIPEGRCMSSLDNSRSPAKQTTMAAAYIWDLMQLQGVNEWNN